MIANKLKGQGLSKADCNGAKEHKIMQYAALLDTSLTQTSVKESSWSQGYPEKERTARLLAGNRKRNEHS